VVPQLLVPPQGEKGRCVSLHVQDVFAVAADSIKRRLPQFTMHQLPKHLKVRLHI
jgi:hypothetical protein